MRKQIALLLLSAVLAGCDNGGAADEQRLLESARASGCAVVPAASDWEYLGNAFGPGQEGEFDRYLWGGFGGSAIRFGDEILLYYQGAAGYSDEQESVSFRAIGLATSPDGTRFRKDPASPILEWVPQLGEEEGVASVAVGAAPQGEILAFYGANTRSGPTTVNADGRWATSVDGRHFTDHGIALDHADPAVFGWGDELFPVIAFYHGDNWFVYYLPNGRLSGRLGIARGSTPSALTDTAGVSANGKPVTAWGMQSAVQLCGDVYALFLNDVAAKTLSVRLTDLREPGLASDALQTYRFPATDAQPEFIQGAVLLDRDAGYWYLYYRTGDQSRYDIRRAPYVMW